MKDEKGFVAIFIVILTPIFLLLLGIVIDVGNMVVSYNMLENATDAALISGLYSVDSEALAAGVVQYDEDKARELVEKFLKENYHEAELTEFEVDGDTIRVETKITVEFVFLRLVDIKSKELTSNFEITLKGGSS